MLPVKVSTSSTIQVRASLYSVHSRLIGASLQVHLYHDHLNYFYGVTMVATLDRVYGQGPLRRAKNIDYKHLIGSLVKNPMVFYKSAHRDALLPNDTYKKIWQSISSHSASREASRLMVWILHLAANTNKEQQIAQRVLSMLDSGENLSIATLQREFGCVVGNEHRHIESMQHHLSSYNDLIPKGSEVTYGMH